MLLTLAIKALVFRCDLCW